MTAEIKTFDISITTNRNAILSATVFQPQQDSNELKTSILLAPATGIKRQFYQAFASYLAQHGYGVITFDNEGIGDSKQSSSSLKDSDASLITWGRADMTAVLERLESEFPNANYHLIGHSAGGQLFGLMPNHANFTSVFNVACSSGQISNMTLKDKVMAKWFMEFFIPVNNLAFGYTKTDVVGMGEPLPKKVAQQWRKWCNGSGYIATDFDKEVTEHFYDDVTLPAMWINSPDDHIANDKNVADMIRVFPNMQATTKTLQPSDYGLSEIGHMKFFSRKSEVLWKMAIEWIDKHS